MIRKTVVLMCLLSVILVSGSVWSQSDLMNDKNDQGLSIVHVAPETIVFHYSPGHLEPIMADTDIDIWWHQLAEAEDPAQFYAVTLTAEGGTRTMGIDPRYLSAKRTTNYVDDFLPLDQYVTFLTPDIQGETIAFQFDPTGLIGLPVQTYRGWIEPMHSVPGNESGRIRVIVKPKTELFVEQDVIFLRVQRPMEDFVSNEVGWRLTSGTKVTLQFSSAGESIMGPHYAALKDHLRYIVQGGSFAPTQRAFPPGGSITSAIMDLDGVIDGTIHLEYSYDPNGFPWTSFPSGHYSDLVTVTVSEIL